MGPYRLLGRPSSSLATTPSGLPGLSRIFFVQQTPHSQSRCHKTKQLSLTFQQTFRGPRHSATEQTMANKESLWAHYLLYSVRDDMASNGGAVNEQLAKRVEINGRRKTKMQASICLGGLRETRKTCRNIRDLGQDSSLAPSEYRSLPLLLQPPCFVGMCT
jgi:hypothetical protein